MEKRGAVFEQRRPCQARCRAAFLSFARPTTEQQRNENDDVFGTCVTGRQRKNVTEKCI